MIKLFKLLFISTIMVSCGTIKKQLIVDVNYSLAGDINHIIVNEFYKNDTIGKNIFLLKEKPTR